MSTASTACRLRRPVPLDPAGFLEAAAGLSSTEVGAMTILAVGWWPEGKLPERPCDCERVLGVQAGHAAALVERLRPKFGPASYFGILRAAHVAKAERRARAGRVGMASRWNHPATA